MVLMKSFLLIAAPFLTVKSLLFIDGGHAFHPSQKHQKIRRNGDASHCKVALPSRRRDFVSFLTTTVTVVTAPPRRPVLATSASGATTAGGIALNYNGVYYDPSHPNGYRVLIGNEGSRTVALTLQDDTSGEVYDLPVQITTVADVAAEDVNKDRTMGVKQFTFDFGPTGGASNVAGTFSRDREGIPVISFPDGTTWKKRETGPVGVYRDGFDPKKIIVIRQPRRLDRQLTVRVIEGDGTTTTVRAKGGNPIILFCLPAGKGRYDDVPNVPGMADAKKKTISFGDGNVWTKF